MLITFVVLYLLVTIAIGLIAARRVQDHEGLRWWPAAACRCT